VEAINGNIKSLLRRGRGYKNLRYLLLKAQRMAHQDRIHRFQESSLKCGSRRIPAQSPKMKGVFGVVARAVLSADMPS
jgi:hypothetical protein